eukprot:sb/3472283/
MSDNKLQKLGLVNDIMSGTWNVINHGDYYGPWDLEEMTIQLHTASAMGSGEAIVLELYDANKTWIGDIRIWFDTPMQYLIHHCADQGLTDLPVQPPVEDAKTWTIAKTETTLTITCNEVEVLELKYENSPTAEECIAKQRNISEQVGVRNRPNQEILVPDWLIISHVT